MKSIRFLYLFLWIGATCSCVNNDDVLVQCAAIDYAIPGLVIEITDLNGTNLLDNGTYNPDDVRVVNNDNTISRIITEENETFVLVLLSASLDNRDINIILSSTETDIINMNLTRKTTGFPCFFPLFEVNEVLYNNTSLTVEQLNFNQKITVVK